MAQSGARAKEHLLCIEAEVRFYLSVVDSGRDLSRDGVAALKRHADLTMKKD